MEKKRLDQTGFRGALALAGFQELNPGSWYLLKDPYYFIVTEGERADLLGYGLISRIRQQRPMTVLFPARQPRRIEGFIARLCTRDGIALPIYTPEVEGPEWEEEPERPAQEAPMVSCAVEPESAIFSPTLAIDDLPVEDPEDAFEDRPVVYVTLPDEAEPAAAAKSPAPTEAGAADTTGRSAYDVLADLVAAGEQSPTDQMQAATQNEPLGSLQDVQNETLEEVNEEDKTDNKNTAPDHPRSQPPWPDKLRFF